MRRHLLSLADCEPAEYETLLQTADRFRDVLAGRTKKVPALQGQMVANLFFEPSTRTRSSFELAAKRLSAEVLNLAAGSSSLSKGETILDTAQTYQAMGTDIMAVRHQQAGVPAAIAAEMDRLDWEVGIINAGDGQHEHPSQALLDLFALYCHLAPPSPRQFLAGKKIAIVGDILHSRVARSNVYSALAMGAEVSLAGPPTLLPSYLERLVDSERLSLHWSLAPALEGANFVMALRLQQERMAQQLVPSLQAYHRDYGLTRERLQRCHPELRLLHPGPVNRGVELESALVDDPQLSLIAQQVSAGLATRMALLYLIGDHGGGAAE
ncbi:MAG: aspartate carbamoyltransferase [Cyanobacteria bacterium QS_8_64_29]|nr:MAG: aspartate carbamoyltransferase [Cyanobacteria bacterium QS_8_64_29]